MPARPAGPVLRTRSMLFSWSPPKIPPCDGVKFRLGFESASDSGVEPLRLSGSGVRTWSIQVKPDDLMRYECECLFQTAHISSSVKETNKIPCRISEGKRNRLWARGYAWRMSRKAR